MAKIKPSTRAGNRSNKQQQRNTKKKCNTTSHDSERKKLAREVCGRFNGFCEASRGVRWDSPGAEKTVAENIRDGFSLVPRDQSGVTGSGGTIGLRIRPTNKDQRILMYDGGASWVASGSATNSWSHINTTANAVKYRVVSQSINIKYCGPPLTAKGFFRLQIIGQGNSMLTFAGVSTWPTNFSSTLGYAREFTCAELEKGITVFLQPNSVQAREFDDVGGTDLAEAWQALSLMSSDLDASALVRVQSQTCLEFVPTSNSIMNTVAKAGDPPNSMLNTAVSSLDKAVTFVAGNIDRVNAVVESEAMRSVLRTISTRVAQNYLL